MREWLLAPLLFENPGSNPEDLLSTCSIKPSASAVGIAGIYSYPHCNRVYIFSHITQCIYNAQRKELSAHTGARIEGYMRSRRLSVILDFSDTMINSVIEVSSSRVLGWFMHACMYVRCLPLSVLLRA